MKKLSKAIFKEAEKQIKSKGRALEQARFDYLFNNGSSQVVITELAKYQNADGGFGHGIEPDFVLPLSSPMATTIGFQVIGEIKAEGAEELIEKGIGYLEESYHQEQIRWFAVPREVNDYPHAPWWNFDPAIQMTVIDYSWGNPSAELIGYLFKYQTSMKTLSVDALINDLLTNLNSKEDFASEHEIYCYLRCYAELPGHLQEALEPKLTKAVQSLVRTNPQDWKDYTPQPTHFVSSPEGLHFGLSDETLAVNIDYLIELLESEGAITPNWAWGQYLEAWEKARNAWVGVQTLKVLKILDNFGRIKK